MDRLICDNKGLFLKVKGANKKEKPDVFKLNIKKYTKQLKEHFKLQDDSLTALIEAFDNDKLGEVLEKGASITTVIRCLYKIHLDITGDKYEPPRIDRASVTKTLNRAVDERWGLKREKKGSRVIYTTTNRVKLKNIIIKRLRKQQKALRKILQAIFKELMVVEVIRWKIEK